MPVTGKHCAEKMRGSNDCANRRDGNRIRNQKFNRNWDTADYEIDFWGPASNFGIPLAAIADMSKDPEMYVQSHHPFSLPISTLFPSC